MITGQILKMCARESAVPTGQANASLETHEIPREMERLRQEVG